MIVTAIVIVVGCTAWAWTKAPAAASQTRQPSISAMTMEEPAQHSKPFTYVDGRDAVPPALDADNQARYAGKEDAEPTAVAKARLAREAASLEKPYPTPNPKKTILTHYRPMPSEPEKVAIIWFD